MKVNKQETQYWSILLIVALSIKLAIYFLDSAPMFFLGDSEAYINTALRGVGFLQTDPSCMDTLYVSLPLQHIHYKIWSYFKLS